MGMRTPTSRIGGNRVFNEERLRDKYQSYVEMCDEEEIDATRILGYDQYCQMYLEILHADPEDEA